MLSFTNFFYKFLLYEEGCFFQRHRDHERMPQMVGTLVLELPSSTYEGGNLCIWSPDKDHEPVSFAVRSECHMSFAAFRSDCFHEVTKLAEGKRCVLVFSLTNETHSTEPPAAAPSARAREYGESEDSNVEDGCYDPETMRGVDDGDY